MRNAPLMLAVTLTLSMTLAGCATRDPASQPGTPTSSANAACLSIKHITPNRGKPKVTTEDVAATLDRDQPIARVRNLVGDNTQTITEIDGNNAALETLCKWSK